MPFFRLVEADGRKKVAALRVALEKGARVAREAGALAAHRNLLRKETKGHSLAGCQKLATEYLALSEIHAGTRQADVALADHKRMNNLILHLRSQRKAAQEEAEKQDAAGAAKIDPFRQGEGTRRRLPDNPLKPR